MSLQLRCCATLANKLSNQNYFSQTFDKILTRIRQGISMSQIPKLKGSTNRENSQLESHLVLRTEQYAKVAGSISIPEKAVISLWRTVIFFL